MNQPAFLFTKQAIPYLITVRFRSYTKSFRSKFMPTFTMSFFVPLDTQTTVNPAFHARHFIWRYRTIVFSIVNPNQPRYSHKLAVFLLNFQISQIAQPEVDVAFFIFLIAVACTRCFVVCGLMCVQRVDAEFRDDLQSVLEFIHVVALFVKLTVYEYLVAVCEGQDFDAAVIEHEMPRLALVAPTHTYQRFDIREFPNLGWHSCGSFFSCFWNRNRWLLDVSVYSIGAFRVRLSLGDVARDVSRVLTSFLHGFRGLLDARINRVGANYSRLRFRDISRNVGTLYHLEHRLFCLRPCSQRVLVQTVVRVNRGLGRIKATAQVLVVPTGFHALQKSFHVPCEVLIGRLTCSAKLSTGVHIPRSVGRARNTDDVLRCKRASADLQFHCSGLGDFSIRLWQDSAFAALFVRWIISGVGCLGLILVGLRVHCALAAVLIRGVVGGVRRLHRRFHSIQSRPVVIGSVVEDFLTTHFADTLHGVNVVRLVVTIVR